MTVSVRLLLAALIAIAIPIISACGSSSDSESKAHAFVVEVEDGKPTNGFQDWQVRKGDSVTYSVTADTDTEIHIHGFDGLTTPVEAGDSATVEFIADVEGVYEIETHTPPVQVGKLTVNPK